MKNNKLLNIIIIIVLIIIFLILAILFINTNPKKEYEPEQTKAVVKEVERVQNHNDFFTVANCVDKYITYLTTKEKDILYSYLDEEYRQKNGITKENIYSYINTLDDYYKFKAKEMYVCKLQDTILQYYVYGTITVETTVNDNKETPFYVSVKLDKVNDTFSIIPNTYIEGLHIKQ